MGGLVFIFRQNFDSIFNFDGLKKKSMLLTKWLFGGV
jgi:hypothetical protein